MACPIPPTPMVTVTLLDMLGSFSSGSVAVRSAEGDAVPAGPLRAVRVIDNGGWQVEAHREPAVRGVPRPVRQSIVSRAGGAGERDEGAAHGLRQRLGLRP